MRCESAIGNISRAEAEKIVHDFFYSDEFSYIGVPLIFVILGALSKWLGRRDGDTAPHRNELAVGSSVLLMTTGKIISDTVVKDAAVSVLLGWTLVGILLVYYSAGIDRHFSWKMEGDKVTNQKKWFWGIWFPNLVAFSFFMGYQLFKLKVK